MRALSMLGAGAQPWSSSICTVHRDRLAYASTLAIYIYQREGSVQSREWRLRGILTEHHTTVSALAWHPARASLLATAAADLRVCVWCVTQQRVLATLSAPSEPTLLEWNPFERETLSFVHLEGRALLTWTAQEGNKKTCAYRDHSNFSSAVSCLNWHPTKPGNLVFGHEDGTLSFYTSDSVLLHLKLDDKESEVYAVRWDPLSEDYLLVAHAEGSLRLISRQQKSGVVTLATFRHPASCRARCIAWLPDCPGMFVTGDEESGVLRIWTVGSETSMENRSLQSSGVRGLLVIPGSDQAVDCELPRSKAPQASASLACIFGNGGLGVYDLKRAVWQLHKEAGHTETVFTCAFRCDESDTLATGSFDGTVKFWSCSSGETKLQASTPGPESIIYSVSWAPAGTNLIAAGTARDGVLIIDTETSRVVQRLRGHGVSTVYCVSWCPSDARRVASGGADGLCLVTQYKGEVLVQSCKHPGTVFGCDWQRGSDLLATGCEDANVRVFKITCTNNVTPIILSGHTAKVFSVRWSVALRVILASGSDDGTARVWDVESCSCLRELTGHSAPVRGLAWSSALPHVLVSGSWDFTIRVWDIRKGSCVALERDHGADVYGLSIHPLRPLLLASCSRDSTVRLWTLEPLVTSLRMKSLLCDQPLEDLIADEFEMSDNWPVRLFGPAATRLKGILSKQQQDATQKFIAVADTLNADPTVRNLWDLINVLRGHTKMSQLSQHYPEGIVHVSHLSACYLADGTRREIHAGKGSRAEAVLREAANCFLHAGLLRRYCEVMIKLGEWDKALAIAPGVSLQFWKALSQRRTAELYEAESENVLPYALARGDVEGLVTFYAARGQLQEAFSLSSLSGREQQNVVDNDEETRRRGTDIPPRLMTTTARALAERYLQSGDPIRAACALLSVNDTQGALQILLRGHELELVITLARALKCDNDPRVHRALVLLSSRARRLSEWTLASRLLQLVDNDETRQHEMLRLLIRCKGSEEERVNIHNLTGLPDTSECKSQACHLLDTSEPSISSRLAATRILLATGQIDQALSVGLAVLPVLLHPDEPQWNPKEALKLVQLLQETGRTNPLLVLYSAYVGCYTAVRLRYARLLMPMVEHARTLIREVASSTGVSCGLREETLQELLSEGEPLVKRLRDEDDADKGIVYVTGCILPAHSALHRCILSGEPIRGPSFALDDVGEHHMSLGDAIMWAKTGAMSPIGRYMNPF